MSIIQRITVVLACHAVGLFFQNSLGQLHALTMSRLLLFGTGYPLLLLLIFQSEGFN